MSWVRKHMGPAAAPGALAISSPHGPEGQLQETKSHRQSIRAPAQHQLFLRNPRLEEQQKKEMRRPLHGPTNECVLQVDNPTVLQNVTLFENRALQT